MRSVFLLLSPAFALQTSFIQADGCEGIITFHAGEEQDLERQFCNFLREVANAHNIPLGGGYSSSGTWSAGKIEEVYAKLMNKVEGAQKEELERAHQSVFRAEAAEEPSAVEIPPIDDDARTLHGGRILHFEFKQPFEPSDFNWIYSVEEFCDYLRMVRENFGWYESRFGWYESRLRIPNYDQYATVTLQIPNYGCYDHQGNVLDDVVNLLIDRLTEIGEVAQCDAIRRAYMILQARERLILEADQAVKAGEQQPQRLLNQREEELHDTAAVAPSAWTMAKPRVRDPGCYMNACLHLITSVSSRMKRIFSAISPKSKQSTELKKKKKNTA